MKEKLAENIEEGASSDPPPGSDGEDGKHGDEDVITWVEFTENTTFHGIKYIFDNKPFGCRRALWFICVVVAVSVFGYVGIVRFLDFRGHKATVNMNVTYPEKLAFPAVTICNQNSQRLTKAVEYELYNYIDAYFSNDPYLERFGSLSNINTTEFIHDAAHRMNDFIDKCIWKKKDCRTQFRHELTDAGICYTFTPRDRMVASPGSRFGLRLVLNVEQYEYMKNDQDDVGVKVLLHDPLERPQIRDQGFVVEPGKHTLVAIKIIKFSGLGQPFDDTSKTAEPLANCQLDCEAANEKKRCNCTNVYMTKNETDPPTCNLRKQFECILAADNNSTPSAHCPCLAPFKRESFEPRLSTALLSKYNINQVAFSQPDSRSVTMMKYIRARDTAQRAVATIRNNNIKLIDTLWNQAKKLQNDLQKFVEILKNSSTLVTHVRTLNIFNNAIREEFTNTRVVTNQMFKARQAHFESLPNAPDLEMLYNMIDDMLRRFITFPALDTLMRCVNEKKISPDQLLRRPNEEGEVGGQALCPKKPTPAPPPPGRNGPQQGPHTESDGHHNRGDMDRTQHKPDQQPLNEKNVRKRREIQNRHEPILKRYVSLSNFSSSPYSHSPPPSSHYYSSPSSYYYSSPSSHYYSSQSSYYYSSPSSYYYTSPSSYYYSSPSSYYYSSPSSYYYSSPSSYYYSSPSSYYYSSPSSYYFSSPSSYYYSSPSSYYYSSPSSYYYSSPSSYYYTSPSSYYYPSPSSYYYSSPSSYYYSSPSSYYFSSPSSYYYSSPSSYYYSSPSSYYYTSPSSYYYSSPSSYYYTSPSSYYYSSPSSYYYSSPSSYYYSSPSSYYYSSPSSYYYSSPSSYYFSSPYSYYYSSRPSHLHPSPSNSSDPSGTNGTTHGTTQMEVTTMTSFTSTSLQYYPGYSKSWNTSDNQIPSPSDSSFSDLYYTSPSESNIPFTTNPSYQSPSAMYYTTDSGYQSPSDMSYSSDSSNPLTTDYSDPFTSSDLGYAFTTPNYSSSSNSSKPTDGNTHETTETDLTAVTTETDLTTMTTETDLTTMTTETDLTTMTTKTDLTTMTTSTPDFTSTTLGYYPDYSESWYMGDSQTGWSSNDYSGTYPDSYYSDGHVGSNSKGICTTSDCQSGASSTCITAPGELPALDEITMAAIEPACITVFTSYSSYMLAQQTASSLFYYNVNSMVNGDYGRYPDYSSYDPNSNYPDFPRPGPSPDQNNDWMKDNSSLAYATTKPPVTFPSEISTECDRVKYLICDKGRQPDPPGVHNVTQALFNFRGRYMAEMAAIFNNKTKLYSDQQFHKDCLVELDKLDRLTPDLESVYKNILNMKKAETVQGMIDALGPISNSSMQLQQVLDKAKMVDMERCMWFKRYWLKINGKIRAEADVTLYVQQAQQANVFLSSQPNEIALLGTSLRTIRSTLDKRIMPYFNKLMSFKNGTFEKSVLTEKYDTFQIKVDLTKIRTNLDDFTARARNWKQSLGMVNTHLTVWYKYILTAMMVPLVTDTTVKELPVVKATSRVSSLRLMLDSVNNDVTKAYEIPGQVIRPLGDVPVTISQTLTGAVSALTTAEGNVRDDLDSYSKDNKMEDAFFMENFLQLDLYYPELSYQTIEYQEAFTFVSLLSEIGGFMGLLLGASVLTVCEVVDFIFLQCVNACGPKRAKKYKK